MMTANTDSEIWDEGYPSPQERAVMTTLFAEGRLTELEALFRMWTVRFPTYVLGWQALATILQQQGQGMAVLAPLHTALAELQPENAEAHFCLGNTLLELGQPDNAAASYLRALDINHDYAEAYSNLGCALSKLGQFDNAIAYLRQALEIKPDFADAHIGLGNALQDTGLLDEAAACYCHALIIRPDFAITHNNLGNTYKDMGRLEEAEASYRRALKIDPNYTDAYNNLGLALMKMGRLDEAETNFLQALQIKPDYAYGYENVGSILLSRGQLDESLRYFRRALELKPDHVIGHSNLIFNLDLMFGDDPAFLLEERKRWDAMHTTHLHQQQTHSNTPDPARRMRIGYVSADFERHSASSAFGGMLTCYDRSQFDIFAYSNLKGKGDDLTELLRQNVTVWRNIIGLSDDAVATMIREDRIDILIDLSGHSAGNRLLVFARKPAPIQVTAWGYAAGTGMRAMDVFFTDSVLVPPQDKQYFTEEVRYLPNAMSAFFIDSFPDVNELPALSDRIVTFGSLNRLVKVSDKAYRTWARILLTVPRSRLILKAAELNSAAARERVAAHFTAAGVAADRIIMLGKTSWYEHMQIHHQIDIALDPFPQGGGVMALEGLMMGIPIISLHGPSLAGRVSSSIMTALGLPDWIAESYEEYVELAVHKATDLQSLALLRQQLRGIFTSSVIGDQNRYARAVEQEYRKLWQEWCSQQA